MNGTVSQGVQQPYEILTVFVSEETKEISLECSAFPNPVDDYIKLKVKKHHGRKPQLSAL